jgi:hypothetical protein
MAIDDTTRHKTTSDELEAQPVAPIPLIYERCARASPPSWRYLVFSSFFTCRLSHVHPHPRPSLCALAGDDHLVVVTSLAHADTLASSSLCYDLIPSFRPRQGPSGLLDSAQISRFSHPLASRICLFTLRYIMPSCALRLLPTSRNERLITVFVSTTSFPTHIAPPRRRPHDFPDTEHLCETLILLALADRGRSGHCMSSRAL